MRIINFLIAIAAFFVVVSCGKATSESETKRWEASQKTLETLGAKYPGFKPALQEVKDNATKAWEEAGSIGDEEKKIAAMSAANDAASPNFVSQLNGISEGLEALKDLATEATQLGGDESDKAALNLAKGEAGRTLTELEGMLKSRNVATAAEAEAVVGEAISQLTAATNRIKKVMDTVKNKQKAAEKAADTTAANADAKAATEAEAKNPIKCGHCGSMNAHDALKCSGCGAPVEKG